MHLVNMSMICILTNTAQWIALLISFLSSSVIFIRRCLVLNKWEHICTPMNGVVWFISITSGVLFWVTLNALRSPIIIQIVTGVLSTILAWLVYVLLVNERLMYPSKQQWMSLLFHVLTEALVLLQVRLVIDNTNESCVLSFTD